MNSLKSIGNILFKYRSYTPLPFVILMLIFANPTLEKLIIGFLTALFGEIIRLLSVSYAGSETRTTESVGGSYLVTQGPYSIVRNPLYIGNIMIYTGIGIMSNALFPYLPLAGLIYFSFQYYCIILNEEAYLSDTFKNKFRVYTETVGRFFPTFKKIPAEIKSDLPFDLNSGIVSEKRSLQAFIFLTAIIITIYALNI
ncbi:MAG TPA: isoprenylcysteine carboxylmethyltransferase family protein [Ignavibacteria bacterium]|nr:isoprenylcysteine carboxylmethyltransferase family protein [Ignavibacteria bacterium]